MMSKRALLYKLGIRSVAPLFIHIPKTGGSYLRQTEGSYVPVIWPIEPLGHCYFYTHSKPTSVSNTSFSAIVKNGFYPESMIGKRKVFSVVRNPFDFLVSWADHAGGWTAKYKNEKQYDYELANKGFEYYLKTIAERETSWPNRKFLFFQLFAESGRFLPNWVCRSESLDKELAELCAAWGLRYRKSAPQRVSTGRKRDYRYYYNDELCELVSKTWGRELAMYGYSFDGVIEKNATVLVGDLDHLKTNELHYDVASDGFRWNN